MLTVTYRPNELKLLELANIVEQSKAYNQNVYFHYCDTPACALGHWAAAHPERWKNIHGIPHLHGTPDTDGGLLSAMLEFELTEKEANEIFSSDGCGGAELDGKRAAEFIRDFVSQKVRQRLSQ